MHTEQNAPHNHSKLCFCLPLTKRFVRINSMLYSSNVLHNSWTAAFATYSETLVRWFPAAHLFNDFNDNIYLLLISVTR